MPDEKCLPVDEMTMQRALALSDISSIKAGRSRQNARFIEFIFSGRLSFMCATRSVISSANGEASLVVAECGAALMMLSD